MGNLRLGQSSRWQVNAPSGTSAWIYVADTRRTGYTPLGAAGTWLLQSPGAVFFAFGVTSNFGQFEFSFTMPNIPALVGTSITSQALLYRGATGAFTVSNPDCKEVENR